VNIYGFINQARYLPDRRDLNRCFPGSEKGSLAARLADVFFREIAALCTHGIDLHTGAIHRDNLPQIRACIADPETLRMARAFASTVIVNTALVEGSMRKALAQRGIPVIVYEAGEALRFDETAIQTGFEGVLAVMRALGMLTGRRQSGRRPKRYTPDQTSGCAPPRAVSCVPWPVSARVSKRISFSGSWPIPSANAKPRLKHPPSASS